MGQTLNSGAVSVNGTISATTLPKLATGQTLVKACAGNMNTGATLYTVTAGKVFTLLGLIYGCQVTGYAQVNLGGVTPNYNMQLLTGTSGAPITTGVLATLTAGQTVVVEHNMGAGKLNCSCWGYEESA